MKVTSSTLFKREKNKSNGKCRKWKFWARIDDGSQRSKRFEGTYSAANDAFKEWLSDLADVIPNAETFGAYANNWLEARRKSGQFSANTIASDERHVRGLNRSPLGSMKMDKIRPGDCRSALMWIRENPQKSSIVRGDHLSNTTMEKFYRICRQIFQQAVDDENLARNPMAKIKDPKPDTPEVEPLSWPQMMQLLDELDKLPMSAYVMALYLIVCLALRRSEACAMMDADMGHTICTVNYAVKERTGVLGPPKSAAGIRNLPVMPRLANKVDQWREYRKQHGMADAPTIANNVRGGVLLPQNLYRWWKQISAQIGFEGVGLHQLRHSNLSHVARHMSAFDLMSYAGWSSLEPTRVYIHDDYESVSRGVMEAWGISPAEMISIAA